NSYALRLLGFSSFLRRLLGGRFLGSALSLGGSSLLRRLRGDGSQTNAHIGDLHQGEVLTVAVAAAVVLAAALLEDDLLLVAELAHDFGGDLRAVDLRSADLVAKDQHFIEHDSGTGIKVQFFHGNDVVFGDAILFAARLDYCEHGLTNPEE